MKIGSIVRLSRPWEHGLEYKDSIGVIENIEETAFYKGDSCRVRLIQLTDKYVHIYFSCLKHRFDILKE